MIVVKRVIGALVITLGILVALGNWVGGDTPEQRETNRRDWPKVIVFNVLTLGAGGYLLWSARSAARRKAREAQLLGYVRARVRVTLADLAAYLDVSPAVAEQELNLLIATEHLALVYHEADREYVARTAVTAGGRVVDTCESCGAPVSARAVFPGEYPRCAHCAASIVRT
ncbi:MAG TPA: hypothetical protein VLX92_00110 [Kofleriaceae bacterium]|nr:hypothetical protein [Kofleriaceae bacterium]